MHVSGGFSNIYNPVKVFEVCLASAFDKPTMIIGIVQVAGGQNRRRLIEMPALAPAVGSCNAVHSLSMIQQTDGSPQAVFEFLLDISDCFLGLVSRLTSC